MPYCRNCGAKLDDDARFCRVCGTPVNANVSYVTATAPALAPVGGSRSVRMSRFWLPIIVGIIVIVLVLASLVVAFAPYQEVTFNRSNQASAANIDAFRLDLNADIANVNVMLRDLPGNQRAVINTTATGQHGIFGSDQPLALSFDEKATDSLIWKVNISRAGDWPIFDPLQVACDVYIDPAVILAIEVTTSTGSITLNADNEAHFQSIQLRANTGSIQANINSNVNISGAFLVQATTGSVQIIWDNPEVSLQTPVSISASTGSVDVNVTQTKPMNGNLTFTAIASTGSVNFAINIQNEIAARISAKTMLGSTSVKQQGFSGNQTPIQSNNYPTKNNIDVFLTTSLGSISIDANYEIGGTRS